MITSPSLKVLKTWPWLLPSSAGSTRDLLRSLLGGVSRASSGSCLTVADPDSSADPLQLPHLIPSSISLHGQGLDDLIHLPNKSFLVLSPGFPGKGSEDHREMQRSGGQLCEWRGRQRHGGMSSCRKDTQSDTYHP